ncbi:MAG: DNA-binding CsgD family transcriptional regulator [Cyclobacteriaceae bacterium]|jgi:DNA-binding CsgD family transcriptional regulator
MSKHSGVIKFTPREYEVMQAISLGSSSKEISGELCISVHTVETHRKNSLKKMNAKNTPHLVRLAITARLIDISLVELGQLS